MYDCDFYREETVKKQQKHLQKVRRFNWQPCLHDSCTECKGTGIKIDRSPCVHGIACFCPKCSPTC